ncbi:MAG: 2-pyrone-4,6-dicarboxylate hydrolase [Rhodovulum sulfidophilum]|uniref:2-pyrone-4,6-dicarboxylate hydrolase n=1 Tax=Rhodovulum sulfidophilum TaxID=35806 RepID=A0A2W5Q7V2_RHOSU|nr:MAG: 2-pyrone-4,6-dicarboxylate hydrolase [Rhodovulum sulfidophilum]
MVPRIDCHCHLLDPARFPYNPASPFHPAGQEIATAAQMGHVFAAHGVAGALLVQPNSGYDQDNACMLAAIAESGGRYRGVAVVPNDASHDQLAELKARGVVGVAFNLPFFGTEYYRGTEALIRRLVDLDLILQIQVEGDQLVDFLPVLGDAPARLLFDHCGRPDPARGLDQPGFAALLRLGRERGAAVKLSGYVKFAARSHPFEDAWPYVRALVDAFTLDRCVWGSDWPFLRARERVDYGPLVRLAETLFPDPADQARLFWHNPRRMFGFDF